MPVTCCNLFSHCPHHVWILPLSLCWLIVNLSGYWQETALSAAPLCGLQGLGDGLAPSRLAQPWPLFQCYDMRGRKSLENILGKQQQLVFKGKIFKGSCCIKWKRVNVRSVCSSTRETYWFKSHCYYFSHKTVILKMSSSPNDFLCSLKGQRKKKKL